MRYLLRPSTPLAGVEVVLPDPGSRPLDPGPTPTPLPMARRRTPTLVEFPAPAPAAGPVLPDLEPDPDVVTQEYFVGDGWREAEFRKERD